MCPSSILIASRVPHRQIPPTLLVPQRRRASCTIEVGFRTSTCVCDSCGTPCTWEHHPPPLPQSYNCHFTLITSTTVIISQRVKMSFILMLRCMNTFDYTLTACVCMSVRIHTHVCRVRDTSIYIKATFDRGTHTHGDTSTQVDVTHARRCATMMLNSGSGILLARMPALDPPENVGPSVRASRPANT